jgi:hypothetical protein
VYEKISNKPAATAAGGNKKAKTEPEKSKYITSLLEQAEKRKRNNDAAYERKLMKEAEAEMGGEVIFFKTGARAWPCANRENTNPIYIYLFRFLPCPT